MSDFGAEEVWLGEDPAPKRAAEIRSIGEEEFVGVRAMGGASVLIMHPQIIGRPGRLGFVVCEDDVRVAAAAV